jgi:hypothetical protein
MKKTILEEDEAAANISHPDERQKLPGQPKRAAFELLRSIVRLIRHNVQMAKNILQMDSKSRVSPNIGTIRPNKKVLILRRRNLEMGEG